MNYRALIVHFINVLTHIVAFFGRSFSPSMEAYIQQQTLNSTVLVVGMAQSESSKRGWLNNMGEGLDLSLCFSPQIVVETYHDAIVH